MNANDLQGCYNLSNPIAVNRSQPSGGTLSGGPFSFCIGDGEADNINEDQIVLSGNAGTNSQWVVTDDSGNILGLPPTFSAVDFDGAGVGTCLVWHLSFEDGLTGAAVGMNANALQGCYSLSNPISVSRNDSGGACGAATCDAAGGTLTGGPFTFDSVSDGTPDTIAAGSITLAGNTGENSQWVITDADGIILGLPPMPSAVDFDGAGVGTCLVWHLSFTGDITGADAGLNANDITGCWSLSNPIEVVRSEAPVCDAAGGTLTGGPFAYCVGDGVADNIPTDGITLEGNAGANSQWVVTDADGNILGLPPTFSVVDFDDAGAGTCLVWHLSFEDGLTGAEVGMNTSDLQGCFNLSNSITVTRDTEGDACSSGAVDGPAVVIINEVIGDDKVELKNIGGETIDISTYWLCDFPSYDQLSNLTVDCGSLMLAAGETVTVETVRIDIDGADGEMGLYTTNNFGSSTAMVDYVEWGSTNHGRSQVAVNANIWTSGDFVASFASDKSLSYDGDGNTPSDWSETDVTACAENGLRSPVTYSNQLILLETMQNPVLDNLIMSISTDSDIEKVTVDIRNVFGNIVNTSSFNILNGNNMHQVEISDMSKGIYYISVRENYGIVQSTIVKQ